MALVVLFIPIKRYTLPSGLPINLEIYRVAVALVLVVWLAALLIDPRVRLRRNRLDGPVLLFVFAILLSLVANVDRLDAVGGDAIKEVSFFISYVLVFYLVVSAVCRRREIDLLVKILAGGGTTLAALALVEAGTGFNLFDHLRPALPFLQIQGSAIPHLSRGGGIRVYASAQHPIALGAAFCVPLPLAVYRAHAYKQRRWWAAAGLMALAIFVTRSRTPILMLGTEVLVYLLLRPRAAKRRAGSRAHADRGIRRCAEHVQGREGIVLAAGRPRRGAEIHEGRERSRGNAWPSSEP